ncbi:hypothetical protein [Motiliproteus sp. MSK22-1]|uniref:hypothetical protein n=1 Tax=Motiliproteus sp. MSK22-1 TaxID=1897630 RepID=UPI000978648F|nr:hypothetical protein [Motiliproteus sp. MSK22-1]OMH32672.1 hypothetical protein BGP75_14105 [Motiliproteus sp. MSK22-1]
MKIILTLGAALILSACSSAQYMSKDWAGVGYQEQRIDNSTYQLSYTGSKSFAGNEEEAWSLIEEFWNKRATELCRSSVYQSSELKRLKPCKTFYTMGEDHSIREYRCFLELKGNLSC